MAERRPAGYPKLKNYKPSRFMLPTSHYDKAKADRAVKFIENLCHTKGKWAGKRFWLLPWQEQLIRDIFGIVKPDGYRQFRTAFVEICKKVGKSELAAAVALYLLYADNEPSAEVYGAAADRQQASIVFDVARQMVEMSPALLKRSKLMTATKRIVNYGNSGYYQVLSAEVGGKHGFSVSGLVFDEIHTQSNSQLYDVLTKGSSDARQNPLHFIITTAGTDRHSIAYELHTKAVDILEGRRVDPTFYPVVYGLKDDEDWEDEANWYKVNPSLGYTVDIERLRDAYREAKQNPADQIPAVGSKPAETYKAGSWNVTPSTETAIAEDTTYTYTYAQKETISATVTFKVVNGSWDDETAEDKTVTLTGYEGDTLYLSAEQIPAVGGKPNDTFKAGSWDVTPNTETAIAEDTTYTYTYAQKDAISATVTFKVVNGSWDDETVEDKTVTLTGYEGDTLYLSADQIPAVGNVPNDTFKEGSWDVTPNAETAITEDTTYTYTYAKQPEYTATEGQGAEYKLGTNGTLTFTFKRNVNDEETFNHFTGVKCDGQLLTLDKDYTAKAGSVIVELQNSYLETLKAGKHTLTVMFDDADSVETTFTIAKADTPVKPVTPSKTVTPSKGVKTGDESQLWLWILLSAMGLAAIGAVTGYTIYRRRKHNQ